MAITAPVAYWKLDESSGNASDSVGSYTLTNNNTVAFSSGKINNGADFVDSSSEYFNASSNIITANSALTVAMWVKVSTRSTDSPLCAQYTSAVAGVWWFNIASGDFLSFSQYDGGSVRTATDNVDIVDGNWHFIVLTVNSAHNSVKFSTDGSSFRTVAITAVTNWATQTFTLGKYGTGSYFNGSMDEVGIWNTELTIDEVQKIYNASRGNSYPFTDNLTTSLFAYYKLDESSGNASDSSGNGYTLTNNGTVTYTTGKINNGALFDNTIGKNLDYNGNLGFAGGGTRTYACWVNVSSFSATGYILDNTTTTAGSGSANKRFILYSENDSKIHMYAGTNEVLTSALSTGTWYFVVVTQNGTTWELFLNGTSQGTTSMGSATISDNSFRIGESHAGGGAGKSTTDEVGIWGRVLTSSEITSLYNSGTGLSYPFTTSTFVPRIIMM
jgi:hypothetical protein